MTGASSEAPLYIGEAWTSFVSLRLPEKKQKVKVKKR